MKGILIVTNIVFVTIIFFEACSPDGSGSGNDKNCSNIFCKDYSSRRWTGVIDFATAKMMSENYARDTAKKYIWRDGACTDSLDARSVWFGIDVLKKFLWEIETNACERGCKDSLGIRIYFARYPEVLGRPGDGSLATVNPRYANQHTLFMVPTYWDPQLRRNFDFNPFRGCRDPLRSTDSTNLIFFMMPSLLEGTGSYEQNHGNLAPPPDEDGTFGD